jgi:hypothetical protein
MTVKQFHNILLSAKTQISTKYRYSENTTGSTIIPISSKSAEDQPQFSSHLRDYLGTTKITLPKSGAGSANNNSAHILIEQGRYAEAREMARKAVSLGGLLQAVYQQTLEEIESKISQ